MTMKKKEEKKTNQTEETPTVESQPKGPTLKEKINKLVDQHEDKDALKKAIFLLIQRIQFPDQFCPECDDRLFLNGQTYECLNCGFTREASVRPVTPTRVPTTQTPIARPTGKVPDAVEKAIQMANENMSDVPRRATPGAKGAHIQKLVEKMGDSSVPPTKQDEEILKGSDPNVRDVNWV